MAHCYLYNSVLRLPGFFDNNVNDLRYRIFNNTLFAHKVVNNL